MQKIARGELEHFVRNVLSVLSFEPVSERAVVVALRGDFGAGKTTFTQVLAHSLGVEDTLQSPTYVLMKSYPLPPTALEGRYTKLVHIDAYRLESPEEFLTLHPDSFLHDPHTLVIVEWPEKVEGVLPKADLTLYFSSEGATEGERYIRMEK